MIIMNNWFFVTDIRLKPCFVKLLLPSNRFYDQASNFRKKFRCSNNCGSSFTHRGSLTRHLRYECQRSPRFKCPNCNLLSKRCSDIYKHIRVKHRDNEVCLMQSYDCVAITEKYPCPKCNRIFEKKGSLSSHLLYACGIEPRFQCPYCDFRSKWSFDVYKHVRRKHQDTAVRCIDISRN
ncbi:zinc finger protein 429-like [Monomorium pharaonis]|uniref:zinc finger protein 429-like n=1 Tax=Monomorium pharaonis TaxID=307658 RepID=UPI001747C85E|nr:zinc finger protein 429-like [Monomorium pharaonis]